MDKVSKQVTSPATMCWATALLVVLFGNCISATPDLLKCEGIKCPPMSEITCPDDSQLREYDSSSVEITSDPAELVKELLSECCVARKCACKLCYIPPCRNSSLIIYEIKPETQIPGQCCGEYDCRAEPNCTEVRDTEGHWLTDCQRCKCVYGQRICHRSCDEVMPNPTTAYCKSKNLNQFFAPGQTWKDGCYECECQNGEEKCVLPFCRSINCPHNRQVTVKGDCCPICWPDSHDDGYYESENTVHEAEQSSLAPLAPPIIVPRPSSSSTTTTTSSTTTTTTTQAPPPPPPPCVCNDNPPATYAVIPEVVEMVSTNTCDRVFIYYTIIGIQGFFLLLALSYICRKEYRKHSYNTVSNFEDFNNFPKTSQKLEKLGICID